MRRLPDLQREVVVWLCESHNENRPLEAVKAGIVSEVVLRGWGLANVRRWCSEYIATLPIVLMEKEEVQTRLKMIVPASLDALERIVTTGRGEKTCLSAIQFIIKEAYATQSSPQIEALSPEEQELDNVLDVVFTSRGVT
jgi:hypothetical protein